jgi:hypothetical protein
VNKYIIATILAAACGPQHVKIDPVTVRPIHLTIDLNVHDKSAPASPPVDPDDAPAEPKR